MAKAALECPEGSPQPRAIFAFNNLMAESALMAIHARGVRCPEVLAQVIESGQPAEPATVMPTRLVLRASCGCAFRPG